MKEILIFAGTTEGRRLSEQLADAGIAHRICVATEYGEVLLKEHPLVTIHRGRMNQEEIKDYIQNGNFAAVVDATHPYAKLVTENIKDAMKEMELPYLRLKRNLDIEENYDGVVYFDTNEACAQALKKTKGNILLTTGSKELAKYSGLEEMKNRLFVRVLPGIESINLCMKQGICGRQILALQGPFSVEMNEAMIRQYGISYLVTKESGTAGGYLEKIEAAKRVGIPVFVIGHGWKDEGYSFDEVCQKLEKICNQKIKQENCLEIILAGIGMGSTENVTKEVQQAIKSADVLLGAKRMLSKVKGMVEKHPIYRAEEILPYLKTLQKKKVVVLFSGDTGFYSGCQLLYQALDEAVKGGRLKARLHIMPGISSVSYLAACLGESYQDAAVYSMHGKEVPNLAHRIKSEKKTFLLTSKVADVNRIGELLIKADMKACKIVVGYQLSYPNQQIRELTPMECCQIKEEGLYTCLIKNPMAEPRGLTHGKRDTEFIRDKVPMTKEEVREVSICKLKLHKDAVVYDIGSGTGSIAVEIGEISEDIRVFAIEQKKEAVDLIEKNKEKFQLENITVVSECAPEGLKDLPVPTHAFIGGSGGRMKEILSLLYEKNPGMRIVINAISMETICELKEILAGYSIEQEEVVQLQVSKVKKAGQYHLMQGENPVWICAFCFVPEMEKK